MASPPPGVSSPPPPLTAGDAVPMDHDDRERADERVRRWERVSSFPLLITSLTFLACYAVLVLDDELPPAARDVFRLLLVISWAIFVLDYLTRMVLSRAPLHFFRTRWLDLVVLSLPLLRPLKMVQTYARAQERRGFRPRLTLEARVMIYTGLTTLLLGFSASLAVYQVEHLAPGGNIHTFGDSVWWACSTLTGVGYGDVFPVTSRGRVIGVAVMLTGLGLLGSVISTFSSWLVNRFRRVGERERPPGP
jgi:voltage-gated potassium channel